MEETNLTPTGKENWNNLVLLSRDTYCSKATTLTLFSTREKKKKHWAAKDQENPQIWGVFSGFFSFLSLSFFFLTWWGTL